MGENAKKVSDDLSVAGQVTPEQLQQAAQEGFKWVLNLRSPSEAGFLSEEEQQSKAVGLHYANIPLQPSEPNKELVDKALDSLEDLAKISRVNAVGSRGFAVLHVSDRVQTKTQQ